MNRNKMTSRNTRIPMPRREGVSSAPPVIRAGVSPKSTGVKRDPHLPGITSSSNHIATSSVSDVKNWPSFVVVTSCASSNSVDISKCNEISMENKLVENTLLSKDLHEVIIQVQTKVKVRQII